MPKTAASDRFSLDVEHFVEQHRRLWDERFFRGSVVGVSRGNGDALLVTVRPVGVADTVQLSCVTPRYVPEGGDDVECLWRDETTGWVLWPAFGADFGRIRDARIATLESTSSTSYGDLTTVGPSVVARTRSAAYVSVYAYCSATSGAALMGFQVSGPSGVLQTPQDDFAISSGSGRMSGRWRVSGLTPGTRYTVTAKYRTNGGTASFADRYVLVEPV